MSILPRGFIDQTSEMEQLGSSALWPPKAWVVVIAFPAIKCLNVLCILWLILLQVKLKVNKGNNRQNVSTKPLRFIWTIEDNQAQTLCEVTPNLVASRHMVWVGVDVMIICISRDHKLNMHRVPHCCWCHGSMFHVYLSFNWNKNWRWMKRLSISLYYSVTPTAICWLLCI